MSQAGPYDLLLSQADYAPRTGPPERTIVICSQPRSGTTLLSEAMYFAGALGCPLEYFSTPFRRNLARRWNTADLHAYYAALHRHRTDAHGVFSTKMFWTDVVDLACELAPAEFAHLRYTTTQISSAFHRKVFSLISRAIPNPEFLFLARRDEVRQALSLFMAGSTGRWRKFSHLSSTAGAPPEYSFDRIVASLGFVQNCNRQWLNFFQANDLRYHALVYEDLAQNYERTLRELFRALNRPDAMIVPPRLHKQADAISEEFRDRFIADFRLRARGKS